MFNYAFRFITALFYYAMMIGFAFTAEAIAAPKSPDTATATCFCSCGSADENVTMQFSPPDGDPGTCASFDGTTCRYKDSDGVTWNGKLNHCHGVMTTIPTDFDIPPYASATLGTPAELGAAPPPTNSFNCGPHMQTYVSLRTKDSADNSVRCVRFFKNGAGLTPRHEGFFWYGEGVTSSGDNYRQMGRYTKGRIRKDFIQEFPSRPGITPSLTAANFSVRYVGVDAAGVPAGIRFRSPVRDVWKRIEKNDAVQYERKKRAPKDCGPNMLGFHVFAGADNNFLNQSGLRCLSIDYLSWYGLGRWNGKSYVHVATTADSKSRWNTIDGEGLPIVAADVCEGTGFCGQANIHLKRKCVATTHYAGPVLFIPEWNEVWRPNPESLAKTKQGFPTDECPSTDTKGTF